MREALTALTPELFQQRASQGFRLVAAIWERDTPAVEGALEQIPFGATVSPDGLHLAELPEERDVLMAMLELIVLDRPISQIAVELNSRGFRNRQNHLWTPSEVFDLLPRLIEVGPGLVKSPEWIEKRRGLTAHAT